MGSAFAANPHIIIFACAKVLLLHLITLFFSKKNLKNQQFYKKTALWHQRSNTIVPKNCGRWKFGFGLLIAFHDRK